MASQKVDELAPQDWKSPAPNDHFSYFTNGETTVILKTLEHFILRPSDKFTSQSLCVYAETIELDGDIDLPGKDLFLICNKLILPKLPSERTYASISVSGIPGDTVTPNTSPDEKNNGKKGGSIVLCVEEFDAGLTPSVDANGDKVGLYMQAYGGAGGRGATNLGDGQDGGGPGGKGGNGGNIRVYFGHRLNDMVNNLSSLVNDAQMPWLAKLKRLRDYDFNSQVSSKIKDHLAEVTTQSIVAAKPLDDIGQLLRIVDFSDPPAGTDPSNSVSKLTEMVEKFHKTPTEPNVVGSTKEAIVKSFHALDVMRQAEPPYSEELWKGFKDTSSTVLAELDKALTTSVKDSDSAVRVTVSDAIKELQTRINYVTKRMVSFYPCLKGSGGRGGKGALPGSKAGDDGDPGDISNKAKIEAMDFSGSERSLSFSDALAHPDQCQMLVNRADLKYFAASGGEVVPKITQEQMDVRQSTLDSEKKEKKGQEASADGEPLAKSPYEEARILYQTVLKRLHFVPALKKQISAGGGQDLTKLSPEERSKYGLALAYELMASNRLSLDPIAQLLQLYDHTVQHLHWSSLGNDFMGHSGLWAPRLTFRFYKKQLDDLKEEFFDLAKSFVEIQGSEKAHAAFTRSQQSTNLQLEGIETRIRLLTTPSSGKLAMHGTQIAECTPIVKAKRNLLQNLIIDAKNKIATSLNWDPKIFLDALSMIAFAPTGINIAAQSASGIYKVATTVQSADGQAVEKSYVISQFGDAGSTIESLTEGYKARPDGPELEVDDPGATKLLATKADLAKLLKSFRDALPDLHKVIEKQLNDYVSIIEKRNTAVMEYNASVKLLAKALADREFYAQKSEELGQAVLSYDPESPTIRLWLVKFRQDLRQTLLAIMYSAERALQFWGLVKRFAPIPAAEDFSDIDLLKARLRNFNSVFLDTLTNWAGNGGTIWPEISSGSLSKGKGKFFHVPSDVVERFRDHPTKESVIGANPPRTNLLYEAYFTIPAVRKGDPKSFADLSGHADVRIDSVRAWLYGTTVGRRDNKAELSITLVHLGNDSIVAPDDDPLEFNHDAVMLRYTYDPNTVKKPEDIAGSIVYDTQRWPSFRELALLAKDETNGNVVAPIGPFATWRLSVSSDENLDLNMSGLTGIVIEFTGASRGFGQTRRPVG